VSESESEREAEANPATDLDRPCDSLDAATCVASRPRCVFDLTGRRCRDPVDDCEGVTPDPSWSGQPVFDRGDPCENVRPGCGWSPRDRRCVLFTALTVCPETLDEAQALQVLCDHSGQAPLSCRYGPTRCECVRPHYCGGAPPPPPVRSPPSTFTCTPPFDARGCPTGAVRNGGACRLDPSVVCTSCATSAQCVDGRWRLRRLPPRP